MNSPKTLIGLSLFLLLSSAVFGVLNGTKVHGLRNEIVTANAQRQRSENQRVAAEKSMKTREAKVSDEQAKVSDNEKRIADQEAEVVKMQTEKSDLQAKLQANETQIAELQKHIEELSKNPPSPNPGAPSVQELQAQLDTARKQVDDSEREKSFLAEKFQPPSARQQTRGPEVMVQRRTSAPAFRGSIRGTVLAVNSAYNFVVLNLGNRNGVETNAEMLVLRGGTPIGKIRISSVEPATAIGDIMTSTLERGVQVQPGDTVIYAGSNS